MGSPPGGIEGEEERESGGDSMRVLERRRKKLFHERKTGRFDAICEQGHVSLLRTSGASEWEERGRKKAVKGLFGK